MKNSIKICGKKFNCDKIDVLYANNYDIDMPYSASNLEICYNGKTAMFGFNQDQTAQYLFKQISDDLKERFANQFFPINNDCLINLKNLTETNIINTKILSEANNDTGVMLTFNGDIGFEVNTNGDLNQALKLQEKIEEERTSFEENTILLQNDFEENNPNMEQ